MGYPLFGMIDLLKLLGGLLVGVFRSHAAREAEMAFLRQQLVVLQRSVPARLRLRTADPLIFVWLYRLFPSLLEFTRQPAFVLWKRRHDRDPGRGDEGLAEKPHIVACCWRSSRTSSARRRPISASPPSVNSSTRIAPSICNTGSNWSKK